MACSIAAKKPDIRAATEELLSVTAELVDGLNLLSGDAHAGLYALHGHMAAEVDETTRYSLR